MVGFRDAEWARAAGVSPVLLTGGTRAHLEHIAQPSSAQGRPCGAPSDQLVTNQLIVDAL
jgi:hypothetical protein